MISPPTAPAAHPTARETLPLVPPHRKVRRGASASLETRASGRGHDEPGNALASTARAMGSRWRRWPTSTQHSFAAPGVPRAGRLRVLWSPESPLRVGWLASQSWPLLSQRSDARFGGDDFGRRFAVTAETRESRSAQPIRRSGSPLRHPAIAIDNECPYFGDVVDGVSLRSW
jgi:hypothetical protein